MSVGYVAQSARIRSYAACPTSPRSSLRNPSSICWRTVGSAKAGNRTSLQYPKMCGRSALANDLRPWSQRSRSSHVIRLSLAM
jgi:hypothetical protein